MAYFTCSRCGTVTSRELHWHAGEWCAGPTQVVEPTPVAAYTAYPTPSVIIPDPPKEPTAQDRRENDPTWVHADRRGGPGGPL